MSDIHFEFHAAGWEAVIATLPEADVLVLAGDISIAYLVPQKGWTWTAEVLSAFAKRYPHVVAVMGNHDYYHGTPEGVAKSMAEVMSVHPNLHVLENSIFELDGVRFIGATMWFPNNDSVQRYKRSFSDFHYIYNFQPWVYERNAATLKFFDENMREGDVVVTHHLPTYESIDAQWFGAPTNVFFLCNVRPLIEERKPLLWVHGHTHTSTDHMIGSTRVLCNPFGYLGNEENPSFNENLIVEVPHESGGAVS